MATSIITRESADLSTWDVPDQDVVGSGGRWTQAGLRAAIDRLCIRYDLPVPEDLDWQDLGDPELEIFQESASRCYLAIAAACALRTTSASPAVAFGAWSATDLAAHLGIAAPPKLHEPDLFTEPEMPRIAPTDSWTNRPVILVGERPERGRFDGLLWDSLLADPRIEDLADGAVILRAHVHPPVWLAQTGGLTDVQAGDLPLECAVEIRESLLLSALGQALDLVERETGARFVPGEPLGSLFERHITPGPEWAAVVPELPIWARTADAFGSTQADTITLWQTLAPVPPTPQADAALRTRACLAHQLFALTAFSPALGWAALLTGSRDLEAVVAAARGAGVRVLPSTVQTASSIWEPLDSLVPTVRPPLRVLERMASTVVEIADSFRVAGPFASIPELARRVPATIATPDILRRLAEAGALDSVCDGALVAANWGVVSDWCKGASDSANPEPMVEGTSLFAIPPAAEAGDQEPDDWWKRFIMDQVSPPAANLVAFAPSDGAVELKDAVPSESRPWRNSGEDLLVMTLRAGDRPVHAVIAPPADRVDTPRSVSVKMSNPPDDGTAAVWIDTALLSAPVGHVEVLVTLLGDRDRDMERLRRVQAIVAQYPGDLQVRLALIHGESRRDLPRSDDAKVAWSAALVDDLEVLLGPDRVRLQTGS